MPTDEVTLIWQVPPARMAANVGNYVERLLNAVADLAQFFAAKIESYAKQNARWTDRTGNARQGLTTSVVKTASAVTLILFHSMSYGIWLEVANAGKYAVILRSLEAHYSAYFSAIQGLMR